MEIISVKKWETLKKALLSVSSHRDKLADAPGFTPSNLLYRGLSNAEWNLDTTLERAPTSSLSLNSYYSKVLASRPQVEAFSDKRWELINLNKYREWLATIDDIWLSGFPGYEYMIYLRHHGFPSPLLDWTRSPYIAAFFAFSTPQQKTKNVALYCYMEYGVSGKSHRGGDSLITTIGPYARSHRRHFLQQCEYTICTKKEDDDMFYSNHEHVFDKEKQEQDYLWKIVAPSSIAPEVLTELDSMNINALSLYGSEDALIETISFREFVQK